MLFSVFVFRFLPVHRYHPFLDYNIAQIFGVFKMGFCTKLTLCVCLNGRKLVIMHTKMMKYIDIRIINIV